MMMRRHKHSSLLSRCCATPHRSAASRPAATVQRRPAPFIALPSVASAESVVAITRRGAQQFLDAQSRFRRGETGPWAAPTAQGDALRAALRDYKGIEAVMSLAWADLRSAVERRGVFDAATQVAMPVPYRLALDLVVERVACEETRRRIEAAVESEDAALAAERRHKQQKARGDTGVRAAVPSVVASDRPVPFVHWIERDRFVDTRAITGGTNLRPPIVAITGHIDHGKTTLLDSLQGSSIAAAEVGGITQSIRCFTICAPLLDGVADAAMRSDFSALGSSDGQPSGGLMTFVDTPGHKIFAEMRLHGTSFADVCVLLVALDEGVQGQTVEVAQTVLAQGKPIVVALNKVDLFTQPRALRDAIVRVAGQLEACGLALTLCDSDEALARVATTPAPPPPLSSRGEATSSTQLACAPIVKTLLDAVCFPPPLPRSLQSGGSAGVPPQPAMGGAMGGGGGPKRRALACCISGRLGTNVPLLCRVLGAVARHKSLRCDAGGPLQAVVVESFHDRRGDVVMNTIVRSGRARRGVAFVADTSYGTIRRMQDQFGDAVASPASLAKGIVVNDATRSNSNSGGEGTTGGVCVPPGRQVCIIGAEEGRCPGSGTHCIELGSVAEARAVAEFRRLLQLFIELNPTKASWLRPPGLDARFLHVGNYGQVRDDRSREYAVLHREAVPAESGDPVDAVWGMFQHDRPAQTEAEQKERQMRSRCVRVLVKTDTWHGSRMLCRELPRLGTKGVTFLVVAARLGTLRSSDFDLPVDFIVAFRTAPLRDGEVAYQLRQRRIRYGEFELYAELVAWVKGEAVAMERAAAEGDGGGETAGSTPPPEVVAGRESKPITGAGTTNDDNNKAPAAVGAPGNVAPDSEEYDEVRRWAGVARQRQRRHVGRLALGRAGSSSSTAVGS